MDILTDKPVRNSTNGPLHELPSYLSWLESGKDGRPFLQGLLVRVLETQLLSSRSARWSPCRITPWLRLPIRIIALAVEVARKSVVETYSQFCMQISESRLFKEEIKLPRHSEHVLVPRTFHSLIYHSRIRHGWKSQIRSQPRSTYHRRPPKGRRDSIESFGMVASLHSQHIHS